MARNDDGEFELILGNRQLVSVFLIVVILMGVFFSMGYIVGRNSTPAIVADNRSNGSGKPIVVDSASKAAPLPEEPATSPPAAAAAPPASGPPAQVQDKPSPTQSSASNEKKQEDTKKAEERKPAVSDAARRAAVGEPAPGTYMQVVATTRADAEIVSESLLKKGFRSMVAPVPDAALYRVLVGPVKDAGEMADLRTRLEAAGFKPYVRKY